MSGAGARPLTGKIALVTGASRGVGRGAALGLGEAGATVYLTGRTLRPGGATLPGSLEETAADVERRGGRAIAVPCDHANDDEVAAVFERIQRDSGQLDILVNNVFAIPDGPLFNTPFWEQPISFWDTMHDVGLRSHYVASVHAAKMMVPRREGLIANISSWGGAKYAVNVAYGVGKAGVDRLSRDTAHELKAHGVTVVSLYPGIVKTERLLAMGSDSPFPLENAESPELTGRAIAALASDPKRAERSGRVCVVAELAREYALQDGPNEPG